MRPIECFCVREDEPGYTFSLSDQEGPLLHSVTSRNAEWRNIRMHMLVECVARQRIAETEQDVGFDGPGALICRGEDGFQIRYYSALGNELAHTEVYGSEAQCMGVYQRIFNRLRREYIPMRFYR